MTMHSEGVSRQDTDVIVAESAAYEGFKNPYISLARLEELCNGDEILEDCLRDMVKLAVRYTETVCRFMQIVAAGQEANEDDTRKEIEKVRSTKHDAANDSVRILARRLRIAGKDADWISKIEIGSREAFGKFALLIAFESVRNERK